MPYLVEFDNYGRSREMGVADTTSHFVWGYNEITWFAIQPEQERNGWLKYAWNWIKDTDPNGHLQMPGNRMITGPNHSHGSYRANTLSKLCPIGYNQERVIKEIWENGHKQFPKWKKHTRDVIKMEVLESGIVVYHNLTRVQEFTLIRHKPIEPDLFNQKMMKVSASMKFI